jgi:hypothetical protein
MSFSFYQKPNRSIGLFYRYPLRWRFGLVGFAGGGDVFYSPGKFSLKSLKPSYGFGLRFAVVPAEKINLRMDFGFTNESFAGPVFTIGEAF